MTNMDFPLTDDADDLPRTLRREREARQREAREREARSANKAAGAQLSHLDARGDVYAGDLAADEAFPATVMGFDVPFAHLVAFFLKAVVAAVPALILLVAMLWVGGQVLKTLFPQLLHMQILIQFPN